MEKVEVKNVLCLSDKVHRLLSLRHSWLSSGVHQPVAPAEPELFIGYLEFFGGSQPCVCVKGRWCLILPGPIHCSFRRGFRWAKHWRQSWNTRVRWGGSNLLFLVVSSKGKKAVDFSMVGISQPMHHLQVICNLPHAHVTEIQLL